MSRERIRCGAKWRLFRVSWIAVVLSGVLCPALALSQAFEVTPSLTVGMRYDDNIFEEGTNEVDDFIGVVTPGIMLRYVPQRDTELTFQYRPSFEFYVDNSSENQVAHRLRLGLTSPPTRRLSATISEELTITEDPADRDRDVDQADGSRSRSDARREQTIRNVAEAEVRYRLSPRTAVGLLFSNLIEDVSDPSEADEIRYSVGGKFSYLTNVARGNGIALLYTATFYTFNVNDASRADEDDFQVHAAEAEYEHRFSPTLTGTARLGYAFTRDIDTANGDDSGPVGGIGLSKDLRTGSASIDYRHEFASGGGSGGAVIADRVVFEFDSNVTAKILASLDASVAILDFQNPDDDDENRLFYTIRPTLTYQMFRFWQLSSSYNFSQTRYDTPNNREKKADRTDHRVSFISRFILRSGLSVALEYQYRMRSFDSSGIPDDNEFTHNLVMLSLTYGPTFRF